MSQDEMEKMMTDSGASAPTSAAPAGGVMSQSEIEKLMGGMASAPQTPAGTVPIQTAASAAPVSGAAIPSMAAPAAGEPNMAAAQTGQVDSAQPSGW